MRDRTILCRSLLMTCALHTRRYDGARECGADIGTIDLEDGVPPARKEAARWLAMPVLATETREGFSRAVRINSIRTEDGLRDLLAILESGARPDILFLPKVESPEELVIVDQVLAGRLPSMALLATLETAAGLTAVDAIAAAPVPRLWGLIFGAADFSADLGATLAWEPLLPARSRIQLAAARSGLKAIDAPCFEVHDRAALAVEIDRSRRMGFAGKAAIHPQQVEAINRGFTPGDAEVVRAREILAASERSHGEICVVRGEMIGPPGVRAARRLLGEAEAIAKREEVLARREG